MKSIIKQLFALFLVCFLLFSAASCSENLFTNDPISKITKEGFAIVATKSIKELCDECSLLVRGKVIEIGKPYDVISKDAPQIVRTGFTIEVNEVFKGNLRKNETVQAWALGGESDTMIMTTDQELPEIGDERFFFIFSDGSYYPRGRILPDGTVFIPESFVPEWFTNSEKTSMSVPAEKVAELIRGYLGQTSTAG